MVQNILSIRPPCRVPMLCFLCSWMGQRAPAARPSVTLTRDPTLRPALKTFCPSKKKRTKTWNQRGAHARRTAPRGSNSSAGDKFDWGVSVCDWQPSWTPPAALFEFFLDRSHSHRFLRSFSVALLDSAAILAAPTLLYERTLLQNRPWDVCIAFDILDS